MVRKERSVLQDQFYSSRFLTLRERGNYRKVNELLCRIAMPYLLQSLTQLASLESRKLIKDQGTDDKRKRRHRQTQTAVSITKADALERGS